MHPHEFRYPKVVPVRPPTATETTRHARQRDRVIASLIARPERPPRDTTPGR
jgi:hypothetical protein